MQQAFAREWIDRWIGPKPDDVILRWLYRTLIAATIGVLILDYADVQNTAADRALASPPIDQPSSGPLVPAQNAGNRRRAAPLRTVNAKLREPMTFDLGADGRLVAAGTIVPGTAKNFADEVAKRGSYVKTVVLQSPGGSVTDALAMGRLIRDKKFTTEVEADRYCASSCPLVFAGGVERRAGANAALGVHQVSAAGDDGLSGAAGMESAQQISAACQKYLREMGIDLEVWIHAMETPREALYYFQPAELLSLKLATQAHDGKAHPAKPAKG